MLAFSTGFLNINGSDSCFIIPCELSKHQYGTTLGIGAGAEFHQPLAIAVIGGFIIALPLLLMVLPSMLRLLYMNHKKDELQQT